MILSKQYKIILVILCLSAGILFFCVHQQWLVVYWNKKNNTLLKQHNVAKKTVSLFIKKDQRWYQEDAQILWSEHDSENSINHLIAQWLNLAAEEQAIDAATKIQSVLLSPSKQELYISFDTYPFTPTQSAHEKSMCIEGLLKTLRENKITIPSVYFLVHHKLLVDYHLDFSQAWPLSGFLVKYA